MTVIVEAALAQLPLVAILRGVEPEDAIEIGEALYGAGFRCLEVPLNSPEPLESIRRLRMAFDGRAVIGAGTVLNVTDVQAVAEVGGQIVISPNTDVTVIRETKALGLFSMPGFFTPSEAFSAMAAGADVLKLFPAEIAGTPGLKAVRAVLPKAARVYAVGGVAADAVATWRAAGADGFGIGSGLFVPGRSPAEVSERARRFAIAWSQPT